MNACQIAYYICRCSLTPVKLMFWHFFTHHWNILVYERFSVRTTETDVLQTSSFTPCAWVVICPHQAVKQIALYSLYCIVCLGAGKWGYCKRKRPNDSTNYTSHTKPSNRWLNVVRSDSGELCTSLPHKSILCS